MNQVSRDWTTIEDLEDTLEELIDALRDERATEGRLRTQRQLVEELSREAGKLLAEVVKAEGLPVPAPALLHLKAEATPTGPAPSEGGLRPAPVLRRSLTHRVQVHLKWTAEHGQRLRTVREGKGWSQLELARRAQTGGPTISNLESGKQRPGGGMLRRLSQALKLEPLELLGGKP